MKKLIRLTEGDLHRIIENSVHKVLNELDNRTVQGFLQGRSDQIDGRRQFSDAMKRRGVRDYENGKFGNWASNPNSAAVLNADDDNYNAVKQYGRQLYPSLKDKRALSTYQNGKWSLDPSKFNKAGLDYDSTMFDRFE